MLYFEVTDSNFEQFNSLSNPLQESGNLGALKPDERVQT
jgi:hypothetical protein